MINVKFLHPLYNYMHMYLSVYFDQILFKYLIQKIKYFHNYFDKVTVEYGFKPMSKLFAFFHTIQNKF